MKTKIVQSSQLSTKSLRAEDYVDKHFHIIDPKKMVCQGAIGSVVKEGSPTDFIYLMSLVGYCEECGARGEVTVRYDRDEINWEEKP